MCEIKRQKLMRPWTEQFTAELNDAEQEWRRVRVRYQAYDKVARAGVRPDLDPFVSLLPAQLAGIADYLQPADRAKLFAASCGLIVSICVVGLSGFIEVVGGSRSCGIACGRPCVGSRASCKCSRKQLMM